MLIYVSVRREPVYYMARVKRKCAFQHAQNVWLHIILHLRKFLSKTCLYSFDPIKPHF